MASVKDRMETLLETKRSSNEQGAVKIKKALEKHKLHLGSHLSDYGDSDDATYTYDNVASVRKVKGGAVKVSFKSRYDEPVWYYKGHAIEMDDSVTKGFWGRWTSGYGTKREAAGSLADLILDLDRKRK